ncbi:hypothetical protein BT63DRAFT_440290 [Microthyrium microscopicum]|uniref:Uncharacterized protein n=1 Tax=Microthyrium microscopicum TaxID=703497 RepID=A0A6A6UDJ4_9PEZI|nr:hypothetical protein BT63DRAFT_440290 [Microthyrium microscopicum]
MFYPVLNHHCPRCSYDTPIPVSASVFSETQHCSHCGTSNLGISVSSPQLKEKESSTMWQPQQPGQQDELAGLFARTMNLDTMTPPPDPQLQAPPPPFEEPKEDESKQIVYTSMHYNHSRHVVPIRFHRTEETTPEPQLPLTDEEMFGLLVQNSIDPHSLFASQVHLLRHADGEQRLRLLELWRISPPNVGSYDLSKQQQSWTTTTMQQEEELAKQRYERMMEERSFGVTRNMNSNPDLSNGPGLTTGTLDITPPERPATAPGTKTIYAEPYMASGYEYLAKREYEQSCQPRYSQATDPVYIAFGQNTTPVTETFDIGQDQEMEL